MFLENKNKIKRGQKIIRVTQRIDLYCFFSIIDPQETIQRDLF